MEGSGSRFGGSCSWGGGLVAVFGWVSLVAFWVAVLAREASGGASGILVGFPLGWVSLFEGSGSRSGGSCGWSGALVVRCLAGFRRLSSGCGVCGKGFLAFSLP